MYSVMRSSTLTSSLLLAFFLSGPAVEFIHAASSDKDAAEAGAALFRDRGCAHCHGEGGIGAKKGPSLVNIRKNKAWPSEKMRDQLLNGGEKMPSFADSLTDDEITKIIAYLRAKHRPVPPPASTQSSATQ